MAGNALLSGSGAEVIIDTPVPGITLWRYPRRQVKGKRFTPYVLSHGPSGFALLPGAGVGNVRAARTKAEGFKWAQALSEVTWRGKPVDWTQPVDKLQEIDRLRHALLMVAGFMVFGVTDKTLLAWAKKHELNEFRPKEK